MKPLRTVLFDLDGTLLDTAGDMTYALNRLREKHQLPELALKDVRSTVSLGARGLISLGMNIDESHQHFSKHIEDFLELYAEHATLTTQLFEGMDSVLKFLEQQDIPWGVVTNKPSRFTFDILKFLELECRAACIVCGDTLAKRKPDPDTILHACSLMQREPSDCVYIGDSLVDVSAAKSSGMPCLIALYGYIPTTEDPFAWRANGYVREATDIIDWLKANPIT